MKFSDPDLVALLGKWAASSDPRERAEAHNIAFEERLDRNRLDALEKSIPRPCSDYVELRRHLSEFIATYIEVVPPHVPPTFGAENSGPSMTPLSPEQKLVRLEKVRLLPTAAISTLTDLERSLASTDSAGRASSVSFLNAWNRTRDNRPVFAAFKDELLGEIHDDDWQLKLRDRLGLADYSAKGGPLAVALMEYTVEEVLAEAARSPAIAHPFCVPTFLDCKPSSQFFPTPRELPAGAPMALYEISSDEDIIAEVLHSRLTYRLHHIKKLGVIDSDGPPIEFKALRNSHLVALQLVAEREDFGEEV